MYNDHKETKMTAILKKSVIKKLDRDRLKNVDFNFDHNCLK